MSLPSLRPKEGPLERGFGVVTAIISADTLRLTGAPLNGNPAPEKEVTLSGIEAPRIQRAKDGEEDEPFAWEAREWVRTTLFGKQLGFSINHVIENSTRQYGNLYLNDEDVASAMVRAGWARVKAGKDGAKVHAERQALLDLEKAARTAKIGLWQEEGTHKRALTWAPARIFFEAHKRKPIRGIVNKVFDGSLIRVEIPGPNMKHQMVSLRLSGVQCPVVPFSARDAEEPADDAPPYALAAKHFVETRLLDQEVGVVLEAADAYEPPNLFGSLLHPRGNIAVKLLENGLGLPVPWTLAAAQHSEELEKAASAAQSAGLRLWSLPTEEAASPYPKEFVAQVMYILSGDTVVILPPLEVNEGKELRISLSSIRAPRMGAKVKGIVRDEENLARESKELLRAAVIGKKVRAVYDYSRTFSLGEGDKTVDHFTLYRSTGGKKDVDVAAEVIGAGLAKLSSHPPNEKRSLNYALLGDQQASARKLKLGLWGSSKSEPLLDLTPAPRPAKGKAKEEDAEARHGGARAHLPMLKGAVQSAVVDYVVAGTRLKLYLPERHTVLMFSLSGVRCPFPADRETKLQDPRGQKALDFVRSRVLQREVRVKIQAADKNDNFLGHLLLGNQNMAVALVQAGLAEVILATAQRDLEYGDALVAAENEAKAARREMWEDFDENANPAEADAPVEPADKVLRVTVTEINDAASFFVHVVDDPAVQAVQDAMRSFEDEGQPSDWRPRRGDSCAGLFHADSLWYRVRVTGREEAGHFPVYFTDFGNHDLLELRDLRPLPELRAKLKPACRLFSLAGLKAPGPSSEYFEDSAHFFTQAVLGKELSAKIELQARDGTVHVTLSEEGQPVSLNRQLLQLGWARVVYDPDFRLKKMCEDFAVDEECAIRNRAGRWERGPVSDDDQEPDSRERPL